VIAAILVAAIIYGCYRCLSDKYGDDNNKVQDISGLGVGAEGGASSRNDNLATPRGQSKLSADKILDDVTATNAVKGNQTLSHSGSQLIDQTNAGGNKETLDYGGYTAAPTKRPVITRIKAGDQPVTN
jgi:hypothetical protein